MSDAEPIVPFPMRSSGAAPGWSEARSDPPSAQVAFDRKELTTILGVYGAKVAAGEWRDYALDFGRETATFSIFRRTSEVPLFRIVKDPKLARRQGAYSVIAQGGLILRRGQDLAQVLRVLMRQPKLSAV